MEKDVDINKESTNKKSNWINEFLWSCAGVNKTILRQCPTDYAKWAGIGGTILFTAIMAALSGGYALNFVFDNVYIAIAFGIFWGLLIFNLDRFIVNTMYSDGKHTISWGELKSGLPRIIMAVFLGIVISTPLELKIFYKEIYVQMEKDMEKDVAEHVKADKVKLEMLKLRRDSLLGSPIDPIYLGGTTTMSLDHNNKLQQLSELRKNQTEYNNKITELNYQITKLNQSHNPEDSVRAQSKMADRRKLREELAKIKTEINKLDAEARLSCNEYNKKMNEAESQRKYDVNDTDSLIHRLENKINSSETSYHDELKSKFGGLRAQMKAFSELRDEDTSTNIAAWFIMFLFVIIETAPTFFKMMMQDGAYDTLLKAEKHKSKVLSDKLISDVNDAVNTSVRISTMKNEKRLEAEIIANQDILEKIAKAQAELLETAIVKWKEAELEKIKQNPSAYIMSTTQFQDGNAVDGVSQFQNNGVSEII